MECYVLEYVFSPMNLLEDITYENVPEEYKENVKVGLLTKDEALRIYKDDLYQAEINEREMRQAMQASQM